jgi:hypothetical protein
MHNHLEDFGEMLSEDGKAIQSYATNYNKKLEVDGRRDLDADWCKNRFFKMASHYR